MSLLDEPLARVKPPNTPDERSRGHVWLEALAAAEGQSVLNARSVLSGEVLLGEETAFAFAVVHDRSSVMPRSRNGEVGLEQALALAAGIHSFVEKEMQEGTKRPLLAIVDTPGQALGREEEAHCLSAACAAAVEAYDRARRAGHPVLTLVVGGAYSGAFLAHGMQADAILALDDEGVEMQVMRPGSIARITRRPLVDVQQLSQRILPMSPAIANAARLGIIDELIHDVSAGAPKASDVNVVRTRLAEHLRRVREQRGGVKDLGAYGGVRETTVKVRQVMREQWSAADALLAAAAGNKV